MTVPPVVLPEVELRAGAPALDPAVERACRIGLAAVNLIHQTLIEVLPPADLGAALTELGAGRELADLWEPLGDASQGMAGISLLQLVDSLAIDVYYQLSRYGLTSLTEDHKELLQTLRHLNVRV
jgi:hypothetical protein